MSALKLFLSLAVLTLSSAAMAEDNPFAPTIEAYMASDLVKNEVQTMLHLDSTLIPEKIDVVPVSGQCGVVGCDNIYLVVQKFSHHGSTAYYQSLAALVSAPAAGEPKVLKIVHLED